jgi:hypothetical protein
MRSDPLPIGLVSGNEWFHTLVCDLHHQYSGYVTKGLTPNECPAVRNSRIRIFNRLWKKSRSKRQRPSATKAVDENKPVMQR